MRRSSYLSRPSFGVQFNHEPGLFVLERKACPISRPQNGTRFPDGASSGNCVPKFGSKTGCAFPKQPSTGNCVPEVCLKVGCRFRLSPWRKVHPGIHARNGMQFPVHSSTGNCVPEFAFRLGYGFPMGWVSESASHSEGSFRDTLSASRLFGKCVPVWRADGHKLSSLYSSTSLSHVGSVVCLTPAVCNFFASTPAERTSFMVKRMSGWP